MSTTSQRAELKEQLRARFVGKTLNEVPTPSVVLDLAKLQVNCQRMLEATQRLGLLWRPHIKTHKASPPSTPRPHVPPLTPYQTTELARLQVGDTLTTPVSLIVSTIAEAENILPLLKEYQSRGRPVNILFSFPLFPTAAPRLAALLTHLGPDSLTLMIDHPSQLEPLATLAAATPAAHRPLIFLKLDTSYGRAGVPPNTPACTSLIAAVLDAEARGVCVLHGLYAHAGHSYAARGGVGDVAGYLAGEVRGLVDVAREVVAAGGGRKAGRAPLVLSLGATPTAMMVQEPGFLEGEKGGGAVGEVEGLVRELKGEGLLLEVHAGVYTTLDMQQLAAHAGDMSPMTADAIAISVVAEVASLYPDRGVNGTTEALITAGSLALGREPVADKGKTPGQDYAGWGFVMPWGLANPTPGPDFPRVHNGWKVGRISQEHGILTWHGPKEDEIPLHYGQRVRVWPNHSCIAGSGFDWYLIVDSSKGRDDQVVDVWPRWRGW
ncbi:hypothetical protein N658DRAFT_488830 [Parathielavia hyrcaniae]|uniref:D-serine dehydratase-like domain-containing protein n=1 Tax=Parathielavia hyrcaniae TaxID=113614 RepID=A0AAN6PWI3_9PEZI|nr:hypothetical protein N658DRAFT_488830 [Parathielavia hyrcaniae]